MDINSFACSTVLAGFLLVVGAVSLNRPTLLGLGLGLQLAAAVSLLF